MLASHLLRLIACSLLTVGSNGNEPDFPELADSFLTQLDERGWLIRGRVGREAVGDPSQPRLFGAFGGEMFEGDFDAYLHPEGATVVASVERLPGFGASMMGRRVIITSYERAPLNLATTLDELDVLLGPWALRGGFRSQEWIGEPLDGDQWKLTAVIPALPMGGGISLAVGKVLRVEVNLTVSTSGNPKKAIFRVVRGQSAAKVQIHQGSDAPKIEDFGWKENEAASISTYVMKFEKAKPTQRLEEVLEQVRRMRPEDYR